MFNLPNMYQVDVDINLKDFIPKDLKPKDKKRIREAIKSVRLEYQIAGEEIPSVINEEYRCQVIQFYDMELENIKDAKYLATIYQSTIKPFCVIRFYDTKDEVYSFAIKRLNQADHMQVVVEESLLTDKYMFGVPDSKKERFLAYMNYNELKNRNDKVQLYKELYYKAYMIINEKAYVNTQILLDGNCWYDADKTERIYKKYMELVNARVGLKAAITNAERIKLNKMIKAEVEELNGKTE